MGSSTERMFGDPDASSVCSAAWSVVVLPEPVGPVRRTIPWGRARTSRNLARCPSDIPSPSIGSLSPPDSSRRIVMRSPKRTGSVATRTSHGGRFAAPGARQTNAPSWGARRSAMSSPAITLMRLTSAGCMPTGRRRNSSRRPSTRSRTRTASRMGSMWTSDACRSTAARRMLSTAETASSAPPGAGSAARASPYTRRSARLSAPGSARSGRTGRPAARATASAVAASEGSAMATARVPSTRQSGSARRRSARAGGTFIAQAGSMRMSSKSVRMSGASAMSCSPGMETPAGGAAFTGPR